MIDGPNVLLAGRAYITGWNNSNDIAEKHTICTGVLGVKASAVLDSGWTHHSNYPIPTNGSYAVAHVSGQMMITTCPSNYTCRGWSRIHCAVEN